MELPRLLQLVVSRLRDVVGCRLAMIVLPGYDGALRVAAADGEGADVALELSMPAGTSKPGRVMVRRQSERVDSTLDDPEHDASEARLGSRAALYVPLAAHSDVIGVLAVHDKAGTDSRFTDADLRLVETFATRAAVAIELSRRVARESFRAVVHAQELERKRLARELHDETGQALTAILLGLRSVRSARDAQELDRAAEELRLLAVAALEDVRQLAFDLRPRALDDFGLEAALERLVERTAARAEIAIELEVELRDRLTMDIETAVYRMVQEALTNVIKHAQAKRVSVVLARREGFLTVLVEDDGVGLDLDPRVGEGFGLVAMRERLALIGGRLDVESRAGSGTVLRASVPLEPRVP
jgi:signal transduction histidine kinase